MANTQLKTVVNPKIVCVCEGGNVRSVALAYVLKYGFGIDALACSWAKNTKETLEMLFKWADVIIVAQPAFLAYVPDSYRAKKTMVIDLGPDRWGNPLHPELLQIAQKLLLKHVQSNKGEKK